MNPVTCARQRDRFVLEYSSSTKRDQVASELLAFGRLLVDGQLTHYISATYGKHTFAGVARHMLRIKLSYP
jgi:hypothetical protein